MLDYFLKIFREIFELKHKKIILQGSSGVLFTDLVHTTKCKCQVGVIYKSHFGTMSCFRQKYAEVRSFDRFMSRDHS